ncbi:hypothetical protein HF265_18035 [Rhizobium leguminosarum]|uniref:hypothetical protein n=1 Tax=Rhizobium leguminosarum TaxID=384 RepID=UPI001C8FDD0B|nr:hypothetical protein [Rhizobium leguminosarum]MBY3030977.1 hypothetical protein [Rhizobium leguminosarum]
MDDHSNERILRELAEIKTLIIWVGVGVFALMITSDHHTPSWLQGLDWVLIIGGLVVLAGGCAVRLGWLVPLDAGGRREELVLHLPPGNAGCRSQAPGRSFRNSDVLHYRRLAVWRARRGCHRTGMVKPRYQSLAIG